MCGGGVGGERREGEGSSLIYPFMTKIKIERKGHFRNQSRDQGDL